jgi:glutamine synthetase
MEGRLTLEALEQAVAEATIDTVIVAGIDMQGRLMGKRFTAQHFLAKAHRGTHGCNYVLATDMEMETVQGYRATSWAGGYGDYLLQPDLATLRRTPWLPGTALVLADYRDHDGGEEIAHAPRTMLKRQIERLAERGLTAKMASELEFFLFGETYEALAERGYRSMQPFGRYNEDYHVFQTTKEEDVLRPLRNGLVAAGIDVECTKGEANAGQEEINIAYSDALDAADTHVIVKNAAKEVAYLHGRAITFMAKWDTRAAGSSSHIHLSLWEGEMSAFQAKEGMTDLMRHFLAGLLAHAPEITVFLAPYVNSYKRFQAGTFAPTRLVWSSDNRTAGFRTLGETTPAARIECRIGGADLTPHLAFAALIAAGLSGIERALPLEPEFRGDAYAAEQSPQIPTTLRAATQALDQSEMLRAAFGDDVVDHYVHAARWEQRESDRVVTDWDLVRGFERC